MLYTPLAPEDVWGTMGEEGGVAWERRHGRLCLARRAPDGTTTVERLFSTDPRDYLDPRFQPGTLW
jgi:hypothetical protein